MLIEEAVAVAEVGAAEGVIVEDKEAEERGIGIR